MAATIHVVDDDASFRTSAGRLLRASGYDVALYESGEQFLAQMPKHAGHSCVLLDVRIPGISGPELQARMAAAGSVLPVVFLTGHGDIPTTVQVIKAGAEDLLTKPIGKEALLNAIERALARGRLAQEKRSQLEVLQKLVSSLTPRERQVLDRVALGVLNKQIAHELGTTERTIKAHRRSVMEKIHAKSVAELVIVAERVGLLGAVGGREEGRPSKSNRSDF